jgi:hypothetical protein
MKQSEYSLFPNLSQAIGARGSNSPYVIPAL